MRTHAPGLAACLLALGCHPSSPAPAPAISALTPTAAVLDTAPAPLTVTAPKLEAFLTYQRTVLELERDAERQGARTRDGGNWSAQAPEFKALAQRADLEDKARTQAGLSVAEADALEHLVQEVIARRVLAKKFGYEAQIRQLKTVREKLPEAQRTHVAPLIAQLEARQQDAEQLPEQRKRWGSANVDVVLAHEAVLAENYQAQLDALTGSAPPPKPSRSSP